MRWGPLHGEKKKRSKRNDNRCNIWLCWTVEFHRSATAGWRGSEHRETVKKCCESAQPSGGCRKCTRRGLRRKHFSTKAVAVRHHPIDYQQLSISMPAAQARDESESVWSVTQPKFAFFSLLGRETFEEMFMLDRRNVMRHRHMQGTRFCFLLSNSQQTQKNIEINALHWRNWFSACQIVYQKLSFLQYIGGDSCNNAASKKSRKTLMLLFAMWVELGAEKKLAMLINSNLNEIFLFSSREIVDSMAVAREVSRCCWQVN